MHFRKKGSQYNKKLNRLGKDLAVAKATKDVAKTMWTQEEIEKHVTDFEKEIEKVEKSVDRLKVEVLAPTMRKARDTGKSWAWIQAYAARNLDVNVSAKTLREWVEATPLTESEKKAGVVMKKKSGGRGRTPKANGNPATGAQQ